MRTELKTSLKASALAAAAALFTLASASADTPRIQGQTLKVVPGNTQAPSWSATDRLAAPTEPAPPIPYPSCPNGFQLAQRGAHVFRCRIIANGPFQASAFMGLALSTSCQNSYWNIGPEAYQGSYQGNTAIYYRCRHTN